MQMWMVRHGAKVRTLAGGVWRRLRRAEEWCPPKDAQETLFEMASTPRQPGARRVERIERAVRFLADGFELRVDDFKRDVSWNRWARVVRLWTRVLAEEYEAAVYMGVTIGTAGEIDWRTTEMIPEDFYAA